MMNASVNALLEIQKDFEGAATTAGIKNEQDVINLVKEIRSERSDKYQCE